MYSNIESEIYGLASSTISTWTGITKEGSIQRFRVLWANWAHKQDPGKTDVTQSFLDFLAHWEIPTRHGIAVADPVALKAILSEYLGDC